MFSTIMSCAIQSEAQDNIEQHSRLQGVDVVRVGGKFRLKEWIGSGSFGS